MMAKALRGDTAKDELGYLSVLSLISMASQGVVILYLRGPRPARPDMYIPAQID